MIARYIPLGRFRCSRRAVGLIDSQVTKANGDVKRAFIDARSTVDRVDDPFTRRLIVAEPRGKGAVGCNTDQRNLLRVGAPRRVVNGALQVGVTGVTRYTTNVRLTLAESEHRVQRHGTPSTRLLIVVGAEDGVIGVSVETQLVGLTRCRLAKRALQFRVLYVADHVRITVDNHEILRSLRDCDIIFALLRKIRRREFDMVMVAMDKERAFK